SRRRWRPAPGICPGSPSFPGTLPPATPWSARTGLGPSWQRRPPPGTPGIIQKRRRQEKRGWQGYQAWAADSHDSHDSLDSLDGLDALEIFEVLDALGQERHA